MPHRIHQAPCERTGSSVPALVLWTVLRESRSPWEARELEVGILIESKFLQDDAIDTVRERVSVRFAKESQWRRWTMD
jgi:hypothetical protein